MSKLLSFIYLAFLLIAPRAFGSDSGWIGDLPRSTIRIQFRSVKIPDRVGVLELGRATLSTGHALGCSLRFNAFPPGKILDGELLIEDATVSLLWESRYYYHVWGKYSFNNSKQDNFELGCDYARGRITIGDFREYLAKINGSIQ